MIFPSPRGKRQLGAERGDINSEGAARFVQIT
jgi:hypothetical protein